MQIKYQTDAWIKLSLSSPAGMCVGSIKLIKVFCLSKGKRRLHQNKFPFSCRAADNGGQSGLVNLQCCGISSRKEGSVAEVTDRWTDQTQPRPSPDRQGWQKKSRDTPPRTTLNNTYKTCGSNGTSGHYNWFSLETLNVIFAFYKCTVGLRDTCLIRSATALVRRSNHISIAFFPQNK